MLDNEKLLRDTLVNLLATRQLLELANATYIDMIPISVGDAARIFGSIMARNRDDLVRVNDMIERIENAFNQKVN